MTENTPRPHRRIVAVSLAFAVTAGLGVAAIVAPSSAEPASAPDALKRSALGPNLIRNSGFRDGLADWSKSPGLRAAKGGVWASNRSAALTGSSKSANRSKHSGPSGRDSGVVLRDKRSTAPHSVAGREYQASVWVRSTKRAVRGHFRLAELRGERVVGRSTETFVAGSGRWKQVTFRTHGRTTGGDLVLSVSAENVGKRTTLKVDRVRLHPVRGPKNVTASPTPTAEPSSSPSSEPTVSPSPSASPSVTQSPTPTPSPTTTASGDTLFGASVYQGSRTWRDALNDSHAAYGGMEVVRVFYPELPGAWPDRAGEVGGSIVVSFKARPADILSGKYDTLLTNWFRNAPTDREIWWTYWHEPEDDVEDGNFTAQQWRDAYRHIALMANAARNPRLHNTIILMCWTVHPRSGRTFADFFPGKDVVETLGWDCYSAASSGTIYYPPSDVYGRAVATSRDLGLPFGIAETGSLKSSSDPDGTKRAAWLRSVGTYLEDQNAEFVTYFDSVIGGDFRLLDAPSQRAWRDVVTGVGVHEPI